MIERYGVGKMEILIVFLVGLIGWVSIIVLHTIAIKLCGEGSQASDETVKDGNNLLVTVVFYLIAFVLCYFIKNNILTYVIMGIGIIFCLKPVFSMFGMFGQAIMFRRANTTILAISAAIDTLVPLAISIMLLTVIK